MGDDDIQIIDSETYEGEGDKQFSHQILVMRAMQKCLEAGCKEMRAGFINEKSDRVGNVIASYVEDTRNVFIESVETLQMIMTCDLDKEGNINIGRIKKRLKDEYNKLCAEEKSDFDNAPYLIKQLRIKNGIFYREGRLHTELIYSNDYIYSQVDASRKIVKELNLLTKRLKFYEEEDILA